MNRRTMLAGLLAIPAMLIGAKPKKGVKLPRISGRAGKVGKVYRPGSHHFWQVTLRSDVDGQAFISLLCDNQKVVEDKKINPPELIALNDDILYRVDSSMVPEYPIWKGYCFVTDKC